MISVTLTVSQPGGEHGLRFNAAQVQVPREPSSIVTRDNVERAVLDALSQLLDAQEA